MKLEPALRLTRFAAPPPTPPVISFFEFWPGWLFYTPVVAHWIALGLRYGDLSLPTAANPHITVGGLCGESKREILDQVAGAERDVLARYTGIVTHTTDPTADVAVAEQAMGQALLRYPVVAKPDIGCNGTGVQLVHDRAGLLRYLSSYPRGTCLLLQEFIPEEGEAGLFYIRHPDEPYGRLTSVTLKYSPFVTGDGRSTLRQLILGDPRAGRLAQLYLPRLAHRQHEVPRQGERVRLVFVGNHCKGSMFRNGTALATEALTDRIDRLAQAMPTCASGRCRRWPAARGSASSRSTASGRRPRMSGTRRRDCSTRGARSSSITARRSALPPPIARGGTGRPASGRCGGTGGSRRA
jgi:hypothetical protein